MPRSKKKTKKKTARRTYRKPASQTVAAINIRDRALLDRICGVQDYLDETSASKTAAILLRSQLDIVEQQQRDAEATKPRRRRAS